MAMPSPLRVRRIGGHGVEIANAAGCEDDGAGTVKCMDAAGSSVRVRVTPVTRSPVLISASALKFSRRVMEGVRRTACDHGLHDGKPGSVAGHAHDALGGMRRLAREDEMAFEIRSNGTP